MSANAKLLTEHLRVAYERIFTLMEDLNQATTRCTADITALEKRWQTAYSALTQSKQFDEFATPEGKLAREAALFHIEQLSMDAYKVEAASNFSSSVQGFLRPGFLQPSPHIYDMPAAKLAQANDLREMEAVKALVGAEFDEIAAAREQLDTLLAGLAAKRLEIIAQLASALIDPPAPAAPDRLPPGDTAPLAAQSNRT